ncbi:adenosine deaminase 2-like [Ptychodera flava]|uniref:adenosine deaminase 2-like n=1 Tax=Ptychodera flava TaxID=63121 RepID=UPI00396A0E13
MASDLAFSIVCVWSFVSPIVGMPPFLSSRAQLLNDDSSYATGSNVELKGKEWAVNDLLMMLKLEEISEGLKTSLYPPAVHFFQTKASIDKSGVFEIIRIMPKGAILHVHDDSLVDLSWLIRNVTYRPGCYMCFTRKRGNVIFKFHEKEPAADEECDWKLVKTERSNYVDADEFDNMLENNISLIVEDPTNFYKNQYDVWSYFTDFFQSFRSLFSYSDVMQDAYYEGLRQFHEDGAQFVEIRSALPPVYDLDGTTYDEEYTLGKLEEANIMFLDDYSDSMGSKVIYSRTNLLMRNYFYVYLCHCRDKDRVTMKSKIELAMTFYQKYPDFVSGFDIVKHENLYNPLLFYWEELQMPSNTGVDLPYFFHASETNWQGSSADENLFDAILLNAKRIGHAYGAVKHPVLLNELKKKDIPIEISPISGQVLKHFYDLRNHPASHMLSHGYPVVVSSDNRAAWGASPASHDFYELFMGIASVKADLRLLKQLAMDSIR